MIFWAAPSRAIVSEPVGGGVNTSLGYSCDVSGDAYVCTCDGPDDCDDMADSEWCEEASSGECTGSECTCSGSMGSGGFPQSPPPVPAPSQPVPYPNTGTSRDSGEDGTDQIKIEDDRIQRTPPPNVSTPGDQRPVYPPLPGPRPIPNDGDEADGPPTISAPSDLGIDRLDRGATGGSATQNTPADPEIGSDQQLPGGRTLGRRVDQHRRQALEQLETETPEEGIEQPGERRRNAGARQRRRQEREQDE